jgi:hypothetical protein
MEFAPGKLRLGAGAGVIEFCRNVHDRERRRSPSLVVPVEGGAPVELAEEFRTRAQRCLKLAQNAPTLEAQTHWLAMAQLWFNLAQHTEEQDAQFLSRSASLLRGERDKNGHSSGEEEG